MPEYFSFGRDLVCCKRDKPARQQPVDGEPPPANSDPPPAYSDTPPPYGLGDDQYQSPTAPQRAWMGTGRSTR